jgi:hypothetical protein
MSVMPGEFHAHSKVSTKPGQDNEADLQVPDFWCSILVSWIATSNVSFHQKRSLRSLENLKIEGLLSAQKH